MGQSCGAKGCPGGVPRLPAVRPWSAWDAQHVRPAAEATRATHRVPPLLLFPAPDFGLGDSVNRCQLTTLAAGSTVRVASAAHCDLSGQPGRLGALAASPPNAGSRTLPESRNRGLTSGQLRALLVAGIPA